MGVILKNGGPAFPRPATAFATPTGMSGDPGAEGISVRDYYAAAIAKGLATNDVRFDTTEHFAKRVFELTDAILNERTVFYG